MPLMESSQRYLIIGGSGFLGSHIVDALLQRGEKHVTSFSRSKPIDVESFSNVTYFTGDIGSDERLRDCLAKSYPTVVFHTVSPSVKAEGLPETEYHRVNVEGTRLVLRACQDAGVKVFVYTSSTAAVWSGQTVKGGTEDDLPVPEKAYSQYARSKGLAEKLVLIENGTKGMRTVALRPPGMIGPRERLIMRPLVQAYQKGQHKIRMGKTPRLTSYSYVGNIADGHILAADRILSSPPAADLVSGEAFFLTDGVPRPNWDLLSVIWKHLGDDGKDLVFLPRWLCYMMAYISELSCKMFGGRPAFPIYAVDQSTVEQWYSIDKARRLLGYEPRISFEDGVKMMLDWWDKSGSQKYVQKM